MMLLDACLFYLLCATLSLAQERTSRNVDILPREPARNCECPEEGPCIPCKEPFLWNTETNLCDLPIKDYCSDYFEVRGGSGAGKRVIAKRDVFRDLPDTYAGSVTSDCEDPTSGCTIRVAMNNACHANETPIAIDMVIELEKPKLAYFTIAEQKYLVKAEHEGTESKTQLNLPPIVVEQGDFVLTYVPRTNFTSRYVDVKGTVCCRKHYDAEIKEDCPEGFFSLRSSDTCYKLLPSEDGWDGSLLKCQDLGGYNTSGRLAFIDTEEKELHLVNKLSSMPELIGEDGSVKPVLVGIKRKTEDCSADFEWTDGRISEPLTFFQLKENPQCSLTSFTGCATFGVTSIFDPPTYNQQACETRVENILCELTPREPDTTLGPTTIETTVESVTDNSVTSEQPQI